MKGGKRENLYAIIVILLIVIVISVYFNKNGGLVSIRSKVDGKKYTVQNRKDKYEAADQLAKICQKLDKFMVSLKEEYPDDERITRLTGNFKCQNIKEGDGAYGYTSYVQNKKDMVMCLRDAQTGNIHRENLLTFVAIHEMSHIMSKTYGHNSEFKANFAFLIEEAESQGVYTHQNFSNDPKMYCGVEVTATPH